MSAVAIVQIQEVSKTQSGSFKAKINGVWHICNKKITAAPTLGSVEVEVGNWHTSDGKDIPTIERWREAPNTAVAQPVQSATQRVEYAQTPKNYMDEASLRYISNVVGQAIAAKTITEPGQILSWYVAAKLALEGKAAPAPFADKIPFVDEIAGKEW